MPASADAAHGRPDPLRALFVSHDAGIAGGAERALVDLVVALRADGRVEPVVALPGPGRLGAELESRGVECVSTVVTPLWTFYRHEHTAAGARGVGLGQRVRRIAAIARRLPAWSRLLVESRAAVVVTNTTTVGAAAAASRLVRVPHVWWVHEFVEDGKREYSYALGARVTRRLIGWSSRVVVANSNAVAQDLARDIDSRKLRMIYCAIEAAPLAPAPATRDSLRLLLLGRQAEDKGVDLALEAVARLRAVSIRVELRLVGEATPEFETGLRRRVEQLGLGDQVEIFGFTPDPRAHLEWANVVLVATTREAFGRVTAEALKSGRPVIATATGGTPEVVHEGIDALLFEAGNVEQLTACIARLAKEPALVESMSTAAVTRNEGRFSMGDEVAAFVAALEAAQAMAKRSRVSPGRR